MHSKYVAFVYLIQYLYSYFDLTFPSLNSRLDSNPRPFLKLQRCLFHAHSYHSRIRFSCCNSFHPPPPLPHSWLNRLLALRHSRQQIQIRQVVTCGKKNKAGYTTNRCDHWGPIAFNRDGFIFTMIRYTE